MIQKETIQPSVVHTTVPIHEVHHNEAKHHATSALPAVSLADFKKQGGTLTGREERYDGFEGEPRAVGSTLGTSSGTTGNITGHEHRHGHDRDYGSTGASTTGHEHRHGHDREYDPATGKKPSLLDRLNPTKDTDGDGKRGVLE